MINLFKQAAQNLPLTPAQRAFLKLLKGWMYTALLAALGAGAQYLAVGQVDWVRLAYIAGGAFVLSVLGAADKYFTAQGDTPASLIVQSAEKQVQQKINQQTTPTPAPKPILFPGINNSSAPALQSQFQTIPAGLSTTNLQSMPSSSPTDIHFGDTNVGLPTV